MTLDYALGGIVAVFLLAYLVVALIRPNVSDPASCGKDNS